ncbi:hypothetical protein ACHWQZ_G008176 [Mnemiopsis leidyi]
MPRHSDKPKPVSVYVRCRPRNTNEKNTGSPSIIQCSKKEVVVKQHNTNLNKKYTFDHVYGPESSQVDVYKGVAQSAIEEVLQGYNCTVFAYGQTGTGKTYTMEGDRSVGSNLPWEKDPKIGLIPRCMSHMFDRLNSQASDFSVRLSMLELYNEELFDLLSTTDSNTTKLRLFEDSTRKGSVVIQGLEEVQVMNKDEVYQVMERAMQKRRTAETLLNAHSSRSHVVFTVTVHIKSVTQDDIGECEEEVFKMGKFNLVDLAGSENIGRSGALNARAREAGNINQSLLTLGRVITALVDRAPHIPYRESKLTRLLQDSLGGRTQTSIIATISPAACNLEETLSTLDYANRAKNILNKPEVNQRSSKKTLIKEYTAEIERLKRELQNSREQRGVYLEVEKFNEMECRMKSQSQLIKEKEDELAALVQEREKISSLFSYSIKQMDGLHRKIDRKQMVESQNKTLINNFIQDTRNRYEMFEEFMSQSSTELVARNQAIDSLLQESNSKNSVFREKQRSCLNHLMETVVKGLDSAVEMRDSQHEQWLKSFLNDQLKPAIQRTISSVQDLENHCEQTSASYVQMLEKEHKTFSSKLEDFEQALKYMTSSAIRECTKILETCQQKRQEHTALFEEQQRTIQREYDVLQDKIEKMNQQCTDNYRQATAMFADLFQSSEDGRANILGSAAKAGVRVTDEDRELQENASELIVSLKHGTDSVVEGHIKLFKEQNSLKPQAIADLQSNRALTQSKFANLREAAGQKEALVTRAVSELTNEASSSRANTMTGHHALLTMQDNVQQEAHLRPIFEKRCEFDMLTVVQDQERQNNLQALAKETQSLLKNGDTTCQQSRGLISEAGQSLQHLGKHVREDLPTGTTPKRAKLNKLNRLKLQQSAADVSLSVIESDEENSDPNRNNEMDVSY